MTEQPGTPLFRFMDLAPATGVATRLHRHCRDVTLGRTGRQPNDPVGPSTHIPVDLNDEQNGSRVGSAVVSAVFSNPAVQNTTESLELVRTAVLGTLPRFAPPGKGSPTQPELDIQILAEHRVVQMEDDSAPFIVIPDGPAFAGEGAFPNMETRGNAAWMTRTMTTLRNLVIEQNSLNAVSDVVRQTIRDPQSPFSGDAAIWQTVFANRETGPSYADKYIQLRRSLFEMLYLGHVLRRWMTLDITQIVDALRLLHTLELLAVDDLADASGAGPPDPTEGLTIAQTVQLLSLAYPRLRMSKTERGDQPMDIAEHLSATPLVNPIFARLFRVKVPFSTMSPVGVGRLKLVRQQPTGYVAGEISQIVNVLKGESTRRVERRKDSGELLLVAADSDSEDSTSEMQTLDRFEMQRSVDEVLRSATNSATQGNLSYDGLFVKSSISSDLTVDSSAETTTEAAETFAKEVVSKAVDRVIRTSSTSRSQRTAHENEDTLTHAFDNSDGESNVSGIYRSVNLQYKAQLYDYGERLMFEFILPQPADLYVESRLQGYAATIQRPRRPSPPEQKSVVLDFVPVDITEEKFSTLRREYELGDLRYPDTRRTIQLRGPAGPKFAEQNAGGKESLHVMDHQVTLDAVGYAITRVRVLGTARYAVQGDPDPTSGNANITTVAIDGAEVWREHSVGKQSVGFNGEWKEVGSATPLANPTALVTTAVRAADEYAFTIALELTLSDTGLLAWRNQVYEAVSRIERQRVERINEARQSQHESEMYSYSSKLADIRAKPVNDLIEGGASATNIEIVIQELKRQCLAQLSKDFDSDPADNLSDYKTVELRPIDSVSHQLTVTEASQVDEPGNSSATPPDETGGLGPIPADNPQTSITFKLHKDKTELTMPKLGPELDRKGKHVRFLEQAFEWHNLAYVFYPYFWAPTTRWIETSNRMSVRDPAFESFLRSGAARALVAVTKGFETAVLHFLATGEPWEGGITTTIDDPLFVQMYDELKARTAPDAEGKAEGKPWTFEIPSRLVYLEPVGTTLEEIKLSPPAPPAAQETDPAGSFDQA